jgi:hypothetical protein
MSKRLVVDVAKGDGTRGPGSGRDSEVANRLRAEERGEQTS